MNRSGIQMNPETSSESHLNGTFPPSPAVSQEQNHSHPETQKINGKYGSPLQTFFFYLYVYKSHIEHTIVEKLDNIFAEIVKVRVLLEKQQENETAVVQSASDDHPLDLNLPVASKDSLEDLEHRLRSEPALKKQLVIIIR